MMPAKMALLKVTVFSNKDHDVITSVYYVINKFPSRDTNFIVDLVMWSNLCDASISSIEAIAASVL